MRTEVAVTIVDDDEAMRSALRRVCRLTGLRVEDYASAQAFLDSHDRATRGCLVLDIKMPGISGLDLQEILAARNIKLPIIFLTGSSTVAMAVKAMKNGAFDFLEKPFENEVLLELVRKAVDHDVGSRYDELYQSLLKERFALLTTREREVMQWVVGGKSSKVIARLLDISVRTVEVHRRNVMAKMQAQSVVELLQMSITINRRTSSTDVMMARS